MENMNALAALILVFLLAALGGCTDSKTHRGGVGLTLMNESAEARYIEVWSNEYPESDGYPADADAFSGWTSMVLHCVEPSRGSYLEEGNYIIDKNYVKVILYELEESLMGEPERGERIAEMRWDNLKCYQEYTVVLSGKGDLALYNCNCEDSEDRRGIEPWPASPE